MKKDLEKYIGIPHVFNGRSFKGVDCIGLIWLFLKEEMCVTVPDQICFEAGIESTEEWRKRPDIKTLYKENIVRGAMELNALGIYDINEIKQGDVLIFGHEEDFYYIGIYVGEGQFLTTDERIKQTHIQKLSNGFRRKFIQAFRVEKSKDGN